jgi:flagellar hook-associated protein 3 FlgL
MKYRVADSSTASSLASRINSQRSRLSVLEERIASGKRINRPSDDPGGSVALIKMRTSQKEIEQFQRTAKTASQKLTATDDTLTGYENMLERVRTLVAQGLSDTSTQGAKNSLATEIETLRGTILNVANSKYGDEYLFGGTRQTQPPYNQTTAAPGPLAIAQFIQIEPGRNPIEAGVTSDKVFADATATIFTDLTNAANALRGTGNAATDRATLQNTMSRLIIYTNQVTTAHAKVGANMNAADSALQNLTNSFLSIDERAGDLEGADFAETAMDLAETQRVLEATLQIAAKKSRNLFDYLG